MVGIWGSHSLVKILSNGETDPIEFVIRFNNEMDVYQVSLLARCRLFAASLRGSAQQWFSKLGSLVVIDSWEQLVDIFIKQFQSSMLYAPPVSTLANMKQKEGETLHDYFKRFNAEVPRVRGANDEAVKNFLIAGVREGTKFWEKLQEQTPGTLSELHRVAEPFKRVEKSLADLKKNAGSGSNGGKGKGVKRRDSRSPRRRQDRSPSPRRRDRDPSRRSPPRARPARDEDKFVPLVASVDHIYAVTTNKGMFTKPPAMGAQGTWNTAKYCDFHEQKGHDTADCWQHKEQIDRLIREGKLTEWAVREVKKHQGNSGKSGLGYHAVPHAGQNAEPRKEREERGNSIHVIIGGPHIGGDSNKARERYAREAKERPLTNVHHLQERPPKLFKGEDTNLMFTEEDAKWVHHPHSDALVVRVRIGSQNIYRVLVDNGSAVNVLMYDVYKKMGYVDKDLIPTVGHLYGFTGASVSVKGLIRLPITLGDEPCITTQVADFMVVDQPSAYNAIVA